MVILLILGTEYGVVCVHVGRSTEYMCMSVSGMQCVLCTSISVHAAVWCYLEMGSCTG